MNGGQRDHLDELLSALLDGEVSAEEEAITRAHLDACPQCRYELEVVRAMRQVVRSLPDVAPPPGFHDSLLRVRWHRRVGIAAVAGVAAAAIAIAGVMSPSEEPVNPQMARLVEAHVSGASVSGDLVGNLVPAGVPVTFAP